MGHLKFVKGDAIAGIIITVVNIVGGLLVGIFQHDLPASEAANIYTILTIGDGLVAQIPALLTSTATAIIITRSNTDDERFATRAVNQLLKDTKSLDFSWYWFNAFWISSRFPYRNFDDNGTYDISFRLHYYYD